MYRYSRRAAAPPHRAHRTLHTAESRGGITSGYVRAAASATAKPSAMPSAGVPIQITASLPYKSLPAGVPYKAPVYGPTVHSRPRTLSSPRSGGARAPGARDVLAKPKPARASDLYTLLLRIVWSKLRHPQPNFICSTRTAHRSKAEKVRISSVHRTCTTNEALSQFRQITFLLISSCCGESGVANM